MQILPPLHEKKLQIYGGDAGQFEGRAEIGGRVYEIGGQVLGGGDCVWNVVQVAGGVWTWGEELFPIETGIEVKEEHFIKPRQ